MTRFLRPRLGLGLLAGCWALSGAQLPLRHYTTADGLANNGVYSIVTDSRGFLWFATGEGLSRFDGYGFANLTQSAGLPHRIVSQVLIGRHGNFWLATPRGLVRFRPDLPQSSADRMLVLRPPGDLISSEITVLLEDRRGTLWCGTSDGLFGIDDTSAPHPSLVERKIGLPGKALYDSVVSGLAEDSEGAVWIGTGNGNLYRQLPGRPAERRPSPVLPDGQIRSLFIDRKDRIWIGTITSLYRSNPSPHPGANGFESLSGQNGLPAVPSVFTTFESREGDIWVALYRFLAQFPADGSHPRIWTKDNGLPSRGVGALGQDQDGNLWMGNGDEGAFRLSAGGMLTYSARDGIGVDGVISLAETVRGELYFGGRLESEGFRIGFPSGDGFQAIAPRVPPQVRYFGWRPARVILQDRDGEWWLASSQGLCRYPRLDSPRLLAGTAPKAVYTVRDGLPSDQVVRLYEDHARNIWLGLETNQTGYWSHREQKFVRVNAEGLSTVSAFGEDGAGHVWIGDQEGAVWRVQEGRAFRVASPADSGVIRDFLPDRAGRLWVVTGSRGLLRFDHPADAVPKFRQYGYADGLSSLNIRGLAEDRNGSIYIGTSSGVDRLDPDLERFRHYTSADGIAGGEVNAIHCDRAGVLWFGTNHGLTRFVPRNGGAGHPPPVWITGLSIAGHRAAVSDAGELRIGGVQVQPGQDQIQFDFVGLNYSPGNVLRYQYRLGDGAWSAPIDSRSVNYGALAPGRYRFAVRAINSDGQVSAQPASVEFGVQPPLWNRLWFQALLISLMAGGAVWVHRARVARLLEIERVRTRIAADLHDDVGSSLSQIAILSEVAHQRATGSKADEPIERIGTLSRELLDSIGDIVWAIQPHKDHLSDLKQRMHRFAADVLSARNVELHWAVTESGRDVELDTELRRQVYLIFKESIHNIARHSQATEARIALLVGEGELSLEVADNGCGIAGAEGRGGNGLASMKLRAARLGGKLEVRPSASQGTIVWLRVPLPV